MSIYDGDTIEKGGRTFRINIEEDTDNDPPWQNDCGTGVVLDWTTRKKRPGELILNTDRNRFRYYDATASLAKAKADSWGLNDDAKAELAAAFGREPTKKEILVEAVHRDYEHLRRWCTEQWRYVGVIVTDITDKEFAQTDYLHALWGIESDCDEYLEEVAHQHIDEILGELADAAAAAEKEHGEAAYWTQRDVITTTLPTQYERHQP